MKILSLRFTNINSLKGEHTISFLDPPLGSAGLILITGPTGSGKSTLLDVISLALYNRIPRLPDVSKKQVGELNSIMTHHTREARAEVYYESNGQRYISRWSIEVNRNGNLNDYHMEIWHENSQQILDLKKSEVASKNADIIGLNYDQFIKSIVLSQGEFAQFLKAKHEDRAELLEKITGTEIYRLIGKKTFEKHKEAKALFTSIQDLLQQLPQAGEAERQELTDDLSATDVLLAEKNREAEAMTQHLQTTESYVKQKQALQNATDELSRWKEEQHIIDGLIEQIKKYDQLLHLRGDLQMLQAAHTELVQLEQDYAAIRTLRDKLTSDIEDIRKLFSNRLPNAREITQISNELDEIKAALLKYESEAESLKRKGIQLRQYTEDLTDKLPAQLRQWHHPRIDPSEALQEIESMLPQDKNEDIALENLSNIQKKLDELTTQKMKLSEARIWKEKQETLKREAIELEGITTRLKTESNELKIEIDNQKMALQTLADRLAQLRLDKETRLSEVALDDLRNSLEDGKPCPLCGATSHPYCDKQLTFTLGSIEIDLHKLEAEYREADEKGKVAMSKYSSAEAQLKMHQTRAKQLVKEKEDLEHNLNQAGFTDSSYAYIVDQINNIQPEIEKWQQWIQTKQTALQMQPLRSAYAEMQQIRVEMEKLKTARDHALPSDNNWKEMQSAWQSYQLLREEEAKVSVKLEAVLERTTRLQERRQVLNQSLQDPLQAIGIRDYNEALALLNQHNDYDKNKIRVQAHDKMGVSLKDRMAVLQQDLVQLEKQLPKGLAMDELQQQSAVLKNTIRELTEKKGRIQEKLTQWQVYRERYESLSVQKDQAAENLRKYELLNQLIGDSQGKIFSNFAQELTMQHIILLANRRLSGLTDRYQLVLPSEDGRTDLFIRDLYLGGTERSVKTLSGGETFILSLALALSLSDLASRNVRLDCLFIDEGFGTLDNDTLDTVISTLEKLQEESDKTIAIISHVESLKERIVSQIRLMRDNSGISKIQLV